MNPKPMTARQTDVYRIYEREAKAGRWTTLSEVARELLVSKPTVVEMIGKMVGKGYLIRVGEGRSVKYRIPDVCPTCGAKGSSPERIEAIRVAIAITFHSSLRKVADSRQSHAVWKSINALTDKEWSDVTRAAASAAYSEFLGGGKESVSG